jgi:hypothetical protein
MDISKCGLKDSPGKGLFGVVFGISGGGLYDVGKSASGYLATRDASGNRVPLDSVVCAATEGGSADLTDCTGQGQFKDTVVVTAAKDYPGYGSGSYSIGRSISFNDFSNVPTFTQGSPPITATTLNGNITKLQVSGGVVQQYVGSAWTTAPFCRSYNIEGKLEYHCLIDKIDYKNNETLTVDTSDGDINLYVTDPSKNAV